jgi:hypothetical protein
VSSLLSGKRRLNLTEKVDCNIVIKYIIGYKIIYFFGDFVVFENFNEQLCPDFPRSTPYKDDAELEISSEFDNNCLYNK